MQYDIYYTTCFSTTNEDISYVIVYMSNVLFVNYFISYYKNNLILYCPHNCWISHKHWLLQHLIFHYTQNRNNMWFYTCAIVKYDKFRHIFHFNFPSHITLPVKYWNMIYIMYIFLVLCIMFWSLKHETLTSVQIIANIIYTCFFNW